MKQSTKLEPIANIRKQQEQNAGRIHGEAIREAQQQKNQLNELMNYREEYIKGFQSRGKSGLSAIQVQEYRLFINRLDEAILQQQQFVTNGQQKCEVSQQEWLNKRTKSEIIDKAVENRQQAENQQQSQREQKDMEDRPYKKFDRR